MDSLADQSTLRATFKVGERPTLPPGTPHFAFKASTFSPANPNLDNSSPDTIFEAGEQAARPQSPVQLGRDSPPSKE